MKLGIATLLFVLLTQVGDKSSPVPPDLSSPEQAIRAFYTALNRQDLIQMAAVVEGAQVTPALRELDRAMKAGEPMPAIFQVVTVSVQVQGDTAKATVTLSLTPNQPRAESGNPASGKGLSSLRIEEKISLRRLGQQWKIVPPTREELVQISRRLAARDSAARLPMSAMAMYPEAFLASRAAAARASCRSNINILTLGALLYGLDHEKLDVTAATLEAKLLPHVRGEKHRFHCPGDPSIRYSFNAKLYGVGIDQIGEPERTVLFYEGKDGVLNFRHGGYAIVGFADGKARGITPQEARTLKWAP